MAFRITYNKLLLGLLMMAVAAGCIPQGEYDHYYRNVQRRAAVAERYSQPEAPVDTFAQYVFLFIGDGMGFATVAATETFLAQNRDKIPVGMSALSFSGFPYLGSSATFSADQQTTDSAAGGSALATGFKVQNKVISISPLGDTLQSVAYKAHDSGRKVGIVTNGPINDATPAAFYANTSSRLNYYPIATQLALSGFEYFAGGDFDRPADTSLNSYFQMAAANGYEIVFGKEEFAKMKSSAEKILYFQCPEPGHDSRNLYSCLQLIDRDNPADISLADLVRSGIEVLDSPDGFFMMAESNTIDESAHCQNLPDLIYETIGFSDAVAVAVEFYREHPDNTLIVVTADHETGGVLLDNPSLLALISRYNNGGYDPGVHFGTNDHTAVRVPVYAAGRCSGLFTGNMDNTEVNHRLCRAMGLD